MRLFNAVAKAQRTRREAEEGGAKQRQASFLAELRGQQRAAQPGQACRLFPSAASSIPCMGTPSVMKGS